MSHSAARAPGVFVGQALPYQRLLSLCHRCHVSALCILYTRLIRTRITVFSASFFLLISESDITELRQQLNHWSLKYHGVERPNCQGVSCRRILECGMTFPALCLTPERWMHLRVQSTVGCAAELCFLQISVE